MTIYLIQNFVHIESKELGNLQSFIKKMIGKRNLSCPGTHFGLARLFCILK